MQSLELAGDRPEAGARGERIPSQVRDAHQVQQRAICWVEEIQHVLER